ncbi:MAG: ABC transporter permease [Bacteroidia bacterium]|nr:ABC transporter permease [Bacteroidia bacterium]
MNALFFPLAEFGYLLSRVVLALRFVWRDRRRVIYQLDFVGVNSIPLVGLIGLFAGAIIAWQAAYQFRGMISLSVLGGQVMRVVMMEMAPVLTALVIAGRIGASMTAELGSMKLSQQIDALRTMSVDPVRYLVMPRFLGLSLMMPILTFFSVVIAFLGAIGVCYFFLDLTPQTFIASLRDFFSVADLLGGLLKGTFFGMIISLVGCFKGMNAKYGAGGLGKATISSFVTSSICILAGDFLLWIILFQSD